MSILQSLPVAAADMTATEARIAAAKQERDETLLEVQRLEILERQSKQWLEISEHLRQTEHKLRETDLVVRQAEAIERDEKRLDELQTVLPVLKKILQRQRGMNEGRCLAEPSQQTSGIEIARFRSEIERALRDLPVDWQTIAREPRLADYQRWIGERNNLIDKETPKRADNLRVARETSLELRQRQAEFVNALATLPKETQQGPSALLWQLRRARDRYQDAMNQRNCLEQMLDLRAKRVPS